jgi:hypothetical protein
MAIFGLYIIAACYLENGVYLIKSSMNMIPTMPMNMYNSMSMGMPMMNPMTQNSMQFAGNASYNVPKHVLYVGNIGPKVEIPHSDQRGATRQNILPLQRCL